MRLSNAFHPTSLKPGLYLAFHSPTGLALFIETERFGPHLSQLVFLFLSVVLMLKI